MENSADRMDDDTISGAMRFGIAIMTPQLVESVEELFKEDQYPCDLYVDSDAIRLIFYDRLFCSKRAEVNIVPGPGYNFTIQITYVLHDKDHDGVLHALEVKKRLEFLLKYKALPFNSLNFISGFCLERQILCIDKKKLLRELSILGDLISCDPADLFPLHKCPLPSDQDALN